METFFGIPKIILTLFPIFVLYRLMLSVPYKNYVFIGIYVSLFVFIIAKMIQANKTYKKRVKATGKKWMFEELIMKFGNFPFIFILLSNILNSILHFIEAKEIPTENTFIILIFSSFLVLLTMLSHVIFFVIPQKAKVYLEEHYPEYKTEII